MNGLAIFAMLQRGVTKGWAWSWPGAGGGRGFSSRLHVIPHTYAIGTLQLSIFVVSTFSIWRSTQLFMRAGLQFFYFLHALYIYILATSYVSLSTKLEWVVYFFGASAMGVGEGRAHSLRIIHCLPARRTTSPLFLFVMNYVQLLFPMLFLSPLY